MPDERHLVLVGLPGAGKTSIGRSVAALLERPFVDFDETIERESGSSVSDLFALEGEGGFRRREHALTERLVHAQPSVLAPGGGWITVPGTVALIRSRALLVWLQVTPSEAARRMGATAAKRPLLAGNPESRLAELLSLRESYYGIADTCLNTELYSPQILVERVAQLATPTDRALG